MASGSLVENSTSAAADTREGIALQDPVVSGATRQVSTFRPDLQFLRAVAVMAVVTFHLSPHRLPGGFVGVDIFFVISGYLITSHIVASMLGGSFSFRAFYLRRARRLLPAAVTVLCASLAAVLLLLPSWHWRSAAEGSLAAALYAENWWLVHAGSDYFNSATVADHYWSLSVEEQFYVLWPLLLLGGVALGRRFGWSGRMACLAVVGVLGCASLVVSAVMSVSDPRAAYLVTYTRAWQFAAGAALALAASHFSWAPQRYRHVLWWLCLAVVGCSMVMLSEYHAVPGWITAIPLAAVIAMIGMGPYSRSTLAGSVMALRPVQFLGDISYALYLWHWPLIVLSTEILGHRLHFWQQLCVLGAAVVLAALTKVAIEDPLRQSRGESAPRKRIAVCAAMVVIGLVAPLTVMSVTWWRSDRAEAELASWQETDPGCIGFGAVGRPECADDRSILAPDVWSAATSFQRADHYRNCLADMRSHSELVCEFGDEEAARHIAVVGDSHALMWLPALIPLAESGDWRITTYLRGSCPVNTYQITKRDAATDAICNAWSDATLRTVAEDPTVDVVVTSARPNKYFTNPDGETSREAASGGFIAAWSMLRDAGKKVVVMGEVPPPARSLKDCLSTAADRTLCGMSREDGLARRAVVDGQPVLEYAAKKAGVAYIDPTNWVCGPSRCEAVRGGIVVYADDSHVTPHYMETLHTPFAQAFTEAVDSR